MKRSLLSVALLAALSTTAQANLITNGDFEAPDLPGGWNVFSTIPGWYTTAGAGIEIQSNGVVYNAQSGNQYVELDSYSNSTMTQGLVDLIVGETYSLTFFYRPRTNDNGNDNGIKVLWDAFDGNYAGFTASNSVLNLNNQVAANYNDWAMYSLDLVATSSQMALSFAAIGKNNSYGGLLDNVSVTGSTVKVPEPAPLALMGLGLLALGLRSRKA